jgi:hypothetical protein
LFIQNIFFRFDFHFITKKNIMSNINVNRVSNTFTPAELTSLTTQHTAYSAIINAKTVTLTDEEEKALPSIDVDNYVFVKDTVAVTDAEGLAMLPPAYAALAPELNKDITFFEQLDSEENWLNAQLKRVQQTKRIVAAESYNVANKFYEQYQNLATAGVAGALPKADKLKARYGGNGGGRQSTPNA